MVTLYFSLETPDKKRLASIVHGIEAALELKFVKDFGSAAKGCLDESICKDLANSLKSSQASLTDESRKLKDAAKEKVRLDAVSSTIASLKARQKSTGCEQKPTCPVAAGGSANPK